VSPTNDRSDILGRRTLLAGGLAAGSLLGAGVPAHAAEQAPPIYVRTYPFTLGVASGDPSHDGFVLWTRLAPEPLADDGLGGMPDATVQVQWQVAKDDRFGDVVASGTVTARPENAHSVHIELDSLDPGRDYWYRFKVASHLSPVGRTRTAPEPGVLAQHLTVCMASCQHYESGFYPGHRGIADDMPDLVLYLGDYQYESAGVAGRPRLHVGPETTTLANYRQRYAQYKTDPDLQAAHAAAPWLVVFDDHEIDNNWADEVPQDPHLQPPEVFLPRRQAAFKAYWENMPLRRSSVPRGIDMQLYRRVPWGRLATFHMLDTRQFRDDQGCGDGYKDCPASIDPLRSITGAEQEAWLIDGFHRSQARWDVLGQQVFFGQRDNNADTLVKVTSQDAWDGYVASRQRLTQGWVDAGVRNPVVVTGDVHANWASDLKLDYDDPTSATVGSEFVTTSISSGGDGFDSDPNEHPFLQINPHLRFYNNLRGYVRLTVTPDQMRGDYQVVPYVSQPGATPFTRASFVTQDGEPGLHQVADNPTAVRAASAPDTPQEWIDYTVYEETKRYT
jgi:alkaline phosphatase D